MTADPSVGMPRAFRQALTFDDVLLVPQRSDVLPDTVETRARLTRRIALNIPLLSSPMDTVTESTLAIAMAEAGGIGIIHKNLSVEGQCREVHKVKCAEGEAARDSGAAASVRTTAAAREAPDRHSSSCDTVTVDERTSACTDSQGRLRVGAAVGVSDDERAEALIGQDVDILVVDTAHGHSSNVIETVKTLRNKYDVDIVAGNIVTADAARELIDAGADALKVGVGPGSICTTRVISGCGVPQLTAIMDVYRAAVVHSIPVIADGGIRASGDITKAIAAGADSVMIGSLLAGVDESPGDTITRHGRRSKRYRGMGSAGAMVAGSADRYGQHAAASPGKLVAEGVEGLVPSRGPAASFLYQLVGGLRAGMGYCGARTIDELRRNAKFCRVTAAGLTEAHPHDVTITEGSLNHAHDEPTDR